MNSLEISDDDIIEMIIQNNELLKDNLYIKKRYREICKNRTRYIKNTVFKNLVLGHLDDELLELVNSKSYDEEEKISPLDFGLK